MIRTGKTVWGLGAALLCAGAYLYLGHDAGTPGVTQARGTALIAEASRERRSGVWVEAAGDVSRILADDEEGSRHQRFIVRLTTEQTLLISHNIDLAPRVPVEQGDRVEFRGKYEWNERGGVVHWTHHAPDGSHAGGWIRHRGEAYR